MREADRHAGHAHRDGQQHACSNVNQHPYDNANVDGHAHADRYS